MVFQPFTDPTIRRQVRAMTSVCARVTTCPFIYPPGCERRTLWCWMCMVVLVPISVFAVVLVLLRRWMRFFGVFFDAVVGDPA